MRLSGRASQHKAPLGRDLLWPPQYRGGVVTRRGAARVAARRSRAGGGGTGPVGGDDVLGQLSRVVDRALAGRGHLLLLAGEAGIGKTTLLSEAAPLRGGPGCPGRVGLGLTAPISRATAMACSAYPPEDSAVSGASGFAR